MRHVTSRGMTLIELMVALAIAALLAALAAPSVAEYLGNSRLRSAGQVLMAQLMHAQNEAIRRNGTVEVSATGSTVRVVDVDAAPLPRTLKEFSLPGGVAVASPVVVRFGSLGRPVPFGSGHALQMTMAGAACATAFRCPVLQVDAGGAMRLCADADHC